ncbi:hypothetical protein [Streptomyces sp. NPDC059708]|uniref:hypothetical protein n=1 Tax=Streptomyces sp. NPDC059708 TaxID=3346916 RepID=UPI0036B4734B
MNAAELAARYDTLALEGCDGAGKSTLAQVLADDHGFTVVHSPMTPDAISLTARYTEILDKPGRLILDRCFISELVYGPLLRDRCRITWPQALELVDLVTTRKGALVHLTAAPELIRARLLARDGEAPQLSELAALVAAYDKVFRTIASHTDVLTIRSEPSGTQPHDRESP